MPPKPPKPPPKPGKAPPHEKEHLPPHLKAKKGLWKNLAISFSVGTIVTSALALVQNFFGIPITVILPVSAPIWIGITTITFTILSKH